MPIKYKNLDRLQRDAKTIKSYLEGEIKCPFPVSTAKILNAISTLFEWPHWNAMNNGFVEMGDTVVWWHQLKWAEKKEQLEKTTSAFVQAIIGNEERLSREQSHQLKEYITTLYLPKDDVLPKKSRGRFARLLQSKDSVYQGLTEHRRREGIELVAPQLHSLMRHLRQELLAGQHQPGCLVVCTKWDVRHFEELFLQKGYSVSYVGEMLGYPSAANSWGISSETNYGFAPSISADRNHPSSIESYFSLAHRQLQAEPGSFFCSDLFVAYLMEVYGELMRQAGSSMNPNNIKTHSLSELIDIARTSPDARSADLIKGYLQSVGLPRDPLPAHDEISELATNKHGFAAMKAEMYVRHLSRALAHCQVSHANALTQPQSPQEGEAMILIVDETERAKTHHLAVLYQMLLSQWWNAQSSSETWVLVPNDRAFLPFTHAKDSFLFAEHNQAHVSTILYGSRPESLCDTSTRVVVVEHGYQCEDLRADKAQSRRLSLKALATNAGRR